MLDEETRTGETDIQKMLSDILRVWKLEQISYTQKVGGNTVSTQIYKGDE